MGLAYYGFKFVGQDDSILGEHGGHDDTYLFTKVEFGFMMGKTCTRTWQLGDGLCDVYLYFLHPN